MFVFINTGPTLSLDQTPGSGWPLSQQCKSKVTGMDLAVQCEQKGSLWELACNFTSSLLHAVVNSGTPGSGGFASFGPWVRVARPALPLQPGLAMEHEAGLYLCGLSPGEFRVVCYQVRHFISFSFYLVHMEQSLLFLLSTKEVDLTQVK